MPSRSSSGSSRPINSQRFMLAVLVAFLAFLVMLMLWPSLVLQQSDTAKSRQSLVWDAMLSVKDPKQILRADDTVYDLTAKRLQVMNEDSNQILLTRPKMIATKQDGTWMRLSAKAGLYNKQSRVLQLIAEVHIEDARGSDLRTDSAVVRLGQREAEGFSRIRGQMGEGIDIDASGFRLQSGQSFYEFLGAAEMIIRTKSEQG